MGSRLGRIARWLGGFYVRALAFALWSALCVLAGAAWFRAALTLDLKRRGVIP